MKITPNDIKEWLLDMAARNKAYAMNYLQNGDKETYDGFMATVHSQLEIHASIATGAVHEWKAEQHKKDQD